MKNNSAKHKAHKLLLKNKLYSLSHYNELKNVIESSEFTIIKYNKNKNSEYVCELIKRLDIENETQQNDSFLYINNKLKLVFINSDVSDEDKCSLLRHELGHICDSDLKNYNYSKIKKEEFANEFSLYVKNPGIGLKLKVFVKKKWKLLVGIMVCVLGLYFMINSIIIKQTKSTTTDASISKNSNSTYYVTSGGKKYHQKFCITVKYRTNLTKYNIDEAIDAGYEPCLICIGQE